jgi:hypothetical protein
MPGLLPAEVQPRSIFSYNRPAEPVIESYLDCIDFVTKANDIAFEVYGADVAEAVFESVRRVWRNGDERPDPFGSLSPSSRLQPV